MFKKSFQKMAVGLAVVAACVCVLPNNAKAATSTFPLTVNKSSSAYKYYSIAVAKDVAYVNAGIELVNGGFPTSYYTITTWAVDKDSYEYATNTFTFNNDHPSTGSVSYLPGYGSDGSEYRLVGRLNQSAAYDTKVFTFRFTP